MSEVSTIFVIPARGNGRQCVFSPNLKMDVCLLFFYFRDPNSGEVGTFTVVIMGGGGVTALVLRKKLIHH